MNPILRQTGTYKSIYQRKEVTSNSFNIPTQSS